MYDLYKDKVYTTTFSGISVKFFETCLKVKPYTLITNMEIRITSTHLLIVKFCITMLGSDLGSNRGWPPT